MFNFTCCLSGASVFLYTKHSWLEVPSRRSEAAESGVVRLGGRGEG